MLCPKCQTDLGRFAEHCSTCGIFLNSKGEQTVESEYRRLRLLDTMAHWAHYTKADQMLREGDIEGLVTRILDEFYHVTLCCGHKVNTIPHVDEEVVIEFEDWSDGQKGMVQGTYCRPCAEEYKKDLKAKEIKLEETGG